MVAPRAALAREVVTVLTFDTSGDTGGLDERMFAALKAQIEFHPDLSLNDVPAQRLDDLLLAVGCATLDEECAPTLADVLGTRLLAWGSVAVTPSAVQVRLTLYDLVAGTEVRTRVHSVAPEDRGLIEESAAVLARSVLYGDDFSLSVSSNAPGATVSVDGRRRGSAPVDIGGLSLGIYRVIVEARGYAPLSTAVVVDIAGATLDASLDVAAPVRERDVAADEPGTASGSLVGVRAAVIAAGAAVAGVGVGMGVASRGTQREFDDVVAEPALDRARAESLADRGERQAHLANGLVAGGVAVAVAGVIWTVVGRDADTPPIEVGVLPGRRGALLQLGAGF